MSSHVFAPSIGGTETVGRLLAQEFSALGHEVRVVTETPGESKHIFSVVRQPGFRALLELHRWADVVFHNNISLRAAWPLMLVKKPWIITHHTWIEGSASGLKKAALRRAANIAISSAIARALPAPSRVIPDPYDAEVFYVRREAKRKRDLVFVGRLVSDKGCDLILDALTHLEQRGIRPSVTIVGEGPERKALEKRAPSRVRFAGAVTGLTLAELLNEHRIMVVPSRWSEPFGVVALEGIACGCAVLGSAGGGLPEAIGPCGRTFPNGDTSALARAIEETMTADLNPFLKQSEAHLKQHHPAAIADKYLDVFRANQ